MSHRHLFEMEEGAIYLNAAYLTPALKAATAAGEKAMHARKAPWKMTVDDFFSGTEKARSVLAKLMNVSSENIALVPSVSYGVETAARNLKIAKGSIILIADGEFPSNVYPWTRKARECDAEVRFVKRGQGERWLDAFTRELDSLKNKVSVVSASTVDWSCGDSFDAFDLRERTRAAGAAFVIDASQSFGVIPLDVKKLDPDFLFSVGYKWQLGPYGLAYLYVSDRYLEGQPLEENWVSRKNSEDFSRLTDYHEGYQPGARRFDSGQKSQFVHMPMAIAALETLLELDPKKTQAYLRTLTDRLNEGLQEMGYQVSPRAQQMGHLLGFKCQKSSSGKIAEHLVKNNIFISCREPYVRISPHVYNSIEEINQLLEVVKTLN